MWIIVSGMIFAATAFIACLFLHQRNRSQYLWAPVAAAIVLTFAVFGLSSYVKDQSVAGTTAQSMMASSEITAWLNSTPVVLSGMSGSQAQVVSSGQGVAPVPDLLGGLQARLEAEPDDPKGWALLAQSHAFVGNNQSAEEAIGQAVARGFDEADLRERVSLASRSQQLPSWIQRTLDD